MNWYGTWIEMRVGLLYLGAILVLGGIGADAGDAGWRAITAETWLRFPWQEFFGPDLTELPLAQTIGRDVLVWAEFAGRLPQIAIGGPVVLGFLLIAGEKSSASREPVWKWGTYLLTLPISRANLVVTRFVVSVAAFALVGAATVLGVAAFRVQGQSLPFGPIVESLALTVVCAATLLAVVLALLASMRAWWILLTFPLLWALAIVPVHYIVGAPVRAEVPWAWLAACPLITCAGLGVTIARARAREY
jgi:hypothetical protein